MSDLSERAQDLIFALTATREELSSAWLSLKHANDLNIASSESGIQKRDSLESQLAEARKLVKGLVECVKAISEPCPLIEATDLENISDEQLADAWSESSKARRNKARQCLKDNAEAIERLTGE